MQQTYGERHDELRQEIRDVVEEFGQGSPEEMAVHSKFIDFMNKLPRIYYAILFESKIKLGIGTYREVKSRVDRFGYSTNLVNMIIKRGKPYYAGCVIDGAIYYWTALDDEYWFQSRGEE